MKVERIDSKYLEIYEEGYHIGLTWGHDEFLNKYNYGNELEKAYWYGEGFFDGYKTGLNYLKEGIINA